MRFLVGVVDSEDVPLNLSREMLQMDAVLMCVIFISLYCEHSWNVVVAPARCICYLRLFINLLYSLVAKNSMISFISLPLRLWLFRKLRRTLTDKIVSFFISQMKKDRVKYSDFYKGYSLYFKEGICIEHDQSVKVYV